MGLHFGLIVLKNYVEMSKTGKKKTRPITGVAKQPARERFAAVKKLAQKVPVYNNEKQNYKISRNVKRYEKLLGKLLNNTTRFLLFSD